MDKGPRVGLFETLSFFGLRREGWTWFGALFLASSLIANEF
jgi:hypothetical protein